MLVVLLLIDGLGYDYLPPDSFWRLHSRPIQNAAPTITAPNWLTILSGLSPERHGVFDNETVSRPSFRFPHSTVFDDFPNSVMVSDWAMMRKISPKPRFYSGNIWKFRRFPREGLVVLNYQRLDTVAHRDGWGSPAYQRTLRNIDRQTRELYESLLKRGTPFVLMGVSDHGGFELDHEEADQKAVRRVPWLVISNTHRAIPRIRHTRQVREAIFGYERLHDFS